MGAYVESCLITSSEWAECEAVSWVHSLCLH